ncbi:MAG: hypothetical protein MZV64_50315 [Ignavibacteriales bacterium]|nr:hypothetical protein [Ignavibacteriales bacterium]
MPAKIEIYLEMIDNVLQLTYLDDGIGFDKEKVMSGESRRHGTEEYHQPAFGSING